MMIRFGVLTLPLLFAALTLCGSPAVGQEGLQAVQVGFPTGLRKFTPGRWGLVEVEVRNESDQDRSLATEVYFRENSEQRFFRDVWVPAKSERTTWVPIYLSATREPQSPLEIIGRVDGRADGAAPFRTPMRVGLDRWATAFVAKPPGQKINPTEDESSGGIQTPWEDAAYEAAIALRASRGLDRTLLSVHEYLLPPTLEGWDAVDYMVITDDRLASDSAGQVAVRQWLASGGRIWLQLNRVSLETARRLLGDAFRVEVVDRVPLTQFHMTGPGVEEDSPPIEPDVEQPVELIRAFVDGAEILHEVDGWPASFAIPFGHGEVVVTTLDAHGWMRLRTSADPEAPDLNRQTKYVANDPLRHLGDRIFLAPPPTGLPEQLQRDYLTKRIGYEVPDRRTVLLILLGFCGSIGLFGGILARRQRLEHLAWLTVVAAILASGSVVAMGWAGRQAVPPTAAQLQTVRVIPQTGDFVASGTIARYAPEQRPASLESSAGGRIDLEMPELSGQIRRLVWTDLDHWHWRGTELPPGVRLLSTQSAARLSAPVRAVGRFGSEGLSGHLDPGPFTAAGDALLAMPYSLPLAANLQTDGSFLATPADLLAEGQFLNEALLSEEQRRRQELYAAWFAQQQESQQPHPPLLMAWAGSLEELFQWPEDVHHTGATLLAIPLTIERTPPDTPVAIPASMIDIRAVAGIRGQSQAFDNRTRSWISPMSQDSATRLRFQLPEAVLPMTVEHATFVIDCNIPSRVVELFAVTDQTRKSIVRRANPSGVVSIPLDDPEWLVLDDEGGLQLEIEVGPRTTAVEQETLQNSGWTIRSTHLQVSGRTLPPAAEASTPETSTTSASAGANE